MGKLGGSERENRRGKKAKGDTIKPIDADFYRSDTMRALYRAEHECMYEGTNARQRPRKMREETIARDHVPSRYRRDATPRRGGSEKLSFNGTFAIELLPESIATAFSGFRGLSNSRA